MSIKSFFKDRSTKHGLFCQIPIVICCVLCLFKALSVFFLSFTNYNGLNSADFVGFRNYSYALNAEFVSTYLGTASQTVILALVMIPTAIIPSFFFAKSKSRWSRLSVVYLLISFLFILCGGVLAYVLSSDELGWANTLLLELQFIDFPVEWLQILKLPVFYFTSVWAVFLITYLGARRGKGFQGATIAICVLPIITTYFDQYVHKICNFYTTCGHTSCLIRDYAGGRFETGFACSIAMICFIMFAVWCLTVCLGAYIINKIYKSKRCVTDRFDNGTYAAAGKVVSVLTSTVFWLIALFIIYIMILQMFRPIDEVLLYPTRLFTLNPTLSNFANVVELNDFHNPYAYNVFGFDYPFEYLYVMLGVCAMIIVPSALGLSLIKSNRIRLWIFVAFGMISVMSSTWELIPNSLHDFYAKLLFGTPAGGIILIFSYLLFKRIFNSSVQKKCLILGSISIFLLCISACIATINLSATSFGASPAWYISFSNNWHSSVSIAGMNAVTSFLLLASTLIPFAVSALFYVLTLRECRHTDPYLHTDELL